MLKNFSIFLLAAWPLLSSGLGYADAAAFKRSAAEAGKPAAEAEFGGVGLVIACEGECVSVAVIGGGPADKAGMIAGDRIVSVNGAPTKGLKVAELAGELRGPLGSTVRLVVQRPGDSEPLRETLVRGRIKIDPKKQFLAVRRGAEAGVPQSQAELARLYAAGQGVEKDDAEAYKWYSLAAQRGLASARKNRDALAERMSADDLARAKAAAGESEDSESEDLQKALKNLDKTGP